MTFTKGAVWSDDLTAKLREWWPTHTAGQIAEKLTALGSPFTRNAVISKVNRIGLSSSTKQVSHPKDTRASKIPARRVGNRPAPPKPVPAAIPPSPFVPRVVDTGPLHLTLLQLDATTCKYECSGAEHPRDFTFCGHVVDKAGPYCASHARLCYENPRKPYKPQRRAA